MWNPAGPLLVPSSRSSVLDRRKRIRHETRAKCQTTPGSRRSFEQKHSGSANAPDARARVTFKWTQFGNRPALRRQSYGPADRGEAAHSLLESGTATHHRRSFRLSRAASRPARHRLLALECGGWPPLLAKATQATK